VHEAPPRPTEAADGIPAGFDRVIGRALAKDPELRYPSAGDLGRAAGAAMAGTAVAVPERTVARGAAATRERAVPTAPSRSSSREAPTRKLRDEPPAGPRNRRPLLIGAGALALIAAVVVAIVLAAGGGEEGAGTASGQTTNGETPPTKEVKEEKKQKPSPEALSAAALIRQADEICEDSQDTYKSYRERFPAGEEEADAVYSQLLVNISSKAVKRFHELKPPPSLKQPYDAYVKAQEEVAKWDKDALKAAEREDLTAYLAAREDRNDTACEREELADAVGFTVCSQPR
jgi:hypothetical protein